MPTYECNSCHTVYRDTHQDGRLYYHTCHPYVIEQRAIFSQDGKELTPEKRTARLDLRDENIMPGLVYDEGRPMREVPDPETPGRILLKPGKVEIVSEGAGRTLVE